MSRKSAGYVPLNNLDLLTGSNPCFFTYSEWSEPDIQDGLSTAVIPDYLATFYDAVPNLPRRTKLTEALDDSLLEKAQNGDLTSTSVIVANNLRLIGYLLNKGRYSKHFHGIAESQQAHDDINQLAVLGLYEALRRYKPTAGKFSTYTNKALFSTIVRAFQGGLYIESAASQSYGPLIRVPNDRAGFHKINAHVQSKGAKASITAGISRQELQAGTSFSNEEIEQYYKDQRSIIPLSESAEAEEIADVVAEITVDEVENKLQCKLQWEEIKPWLKPREFVALYLREVKELTFEEIGNKLGITAERTRQIYNRTIDELRSNPAVVHKLDIPVICDPYFPYATKWRKDSPCPINSLPSPAQIIERNGKVYGKHQLALNFKHIAWLPDKLKKAAIKNFRGATSDMLTKKRAQFRSRHSV